MSEEIVSNYDLIYKLKQYMAKHILSLTEDEKNLLETIIRRLQNAEY